MRTCTVEGCDAEHKGHGLCYQHLWRMKRQGPDFDRSPIKRAPHRHQTVCSIEGCGLPHKTRGYCAGHYTRWQRQGEDFDCSPIVRSEKTGDDLIAQSLREATPEKCIEWPLLRNRQGYGEVTINSKKTSAHREACRRAHGPPPSPKHHACHSCDNPCCYNYHHLRWDTAKGNVADRSIRGRGLKGETHHKAKLTEVQVRDIRRRLATGETCQALADDYGVQNGTIWFIAKGLHWKHVA